ncbi:acid protease [Trametes sanguinea]|nr:acid protease [Trametes sanguinea]
MQLALSFTTLLASVLFVLSATSNVEAVPAKRSRAVTLPLTRIHQNRGDVHPQVLLQQHINRGLKRYARMKGREPPSKRDMEEKIAKRMYIPEGGRPKFNANSKRYNRKGAAKVNALGTAETVSDTFEAFAKGLKEAAQGGKGKKHKQAQAQAAASGSNSGNSTGATDADNGSLTAANPPTASNSLGLDIEAQDVGYIATIQMGTPPRDFHILMDSGSADLWVGAEGCQSQGGGGCGNHQFLGTQSSSTFKDLGQQFQVTYGTGAVAGDVIQDNINVAGLALNGHTFGVAAEETVDFSSDTVPFDGLMGLAQSTLSEQGVPTPVEALAKAGLIDDAITSYKISRLADNKNDGEITFGALDETKFDPNTLVTFPVVSQTGFWEGAMDAVSVDGQDLGLQGRTAILDTGTTLISDGQGGFIIPCSTNASVALTFSGQAFAIDTRDLVFQQIDQENCASGISSGEIDGETTWLVGDVFLKNAYFSTDVTKNTISLAKLV